MERTLVILKPDTLRRKLAGEIIARFEKKNLEISKLKLAPINRETAEAHYAHVRGFVHYAEMIDYVTSAPSLILVLTGEKAVSVVRGMIGKTNSFEALPGSIRGDYGAHLFENLVHASDSTENAEIEINRFFG